MASGELDDDAHVATDGMQVRREGRDEQVAALLDLRDIALRHLEPTREFHLRQAKRVAQRSQTHRVFARQMRRIYESSTVAGANAAFEDFAEQWRDTYLAMIRSWENAWAEFVPFLEFPVELRKIVYTTNAIESLNARFRRAVRHRGQIGRAHV